MTIENQSAPRGRPPRTAERRERRRKDGDIEGNDLKLPIPDWVAEKYPATDYRLRWFRDEPGRLATKFKQDWDPVEGVQPVPGAQDKFGNPINHVLHVKHEDWYQADRARMEDRRAEIIKQMERGTVKGQGDDAGQTLRSEVSYADAANRLG